MVPRPAPLRQRAARRLRHGHRARRDLDLRPRSPARGDSVSADAVPDLPVTTGKAQDSRMKIGFLSLGCPKNLVDGEVMLGMAREAGHEITTDAADADVLVVNTCAFIDSAKQESIDAILEMAAQKRDGKLLAARRHRLPGRALPRRAAGRRSPRSTPCSARGKCRRFWTRSDPRIRDRDRESGSPRRRCR